MPSPSDKTTFNEETKLLATALNTGASSCFTVGIATPLAGYIYNVSNLQGSLGLGTLALGIIGWFVAAACLHWIARLVLRRLKP